MKYVVENLSEDAIRKIIREEIQSVFSTIRMKIDISDIISQVRQPPTSNSIRGFINGEYRFTAALKERACRAAKDTYDFIDANMRDALFQTDQFRVIDARKDEIAPDGTLIMDLGVFKGGSTRSLASIFPRHTIHGFDSFEGLPEDWSHSMKGAFGDLRGLPEMPGNVQLYKGWFEDTLPIWAENYKGQTVSLLRVDCDIYSSTKTIFENVGKMLKPGSWICFDELFGYYGWQDHENKAFMEFIEESRLKYEFKAYGLTYALAKLI